MKIWVLSGFNKIKTKKYETWVSQPRFSSPDPSNKPIKAKDLEAASSGDLILKSQQSTLTLH